MYKLSIMNSLTVLLLILFMNGCGNGSKIPAEFKNDTTVPDSVYSNDSLYFTSQIMSLIENKESAFYPKTYNHSTSEVFIDSIIYSPKLTRAAFFVIIKNSNRELLVTSNPEGSHFDAKTFLAERNDESGEWALKWFRIMNINRYSNYDEISKLIRKRYFEDLRKINDENGQSRYKYNLNDVRFWESSAWSKKPQMLEHNFSGDAN